MAKYPYGFPDFDVTDDDEIIKASLTSSSDIGGADTQSGTQDFTANGMDVGASYGLKWNGVTGQSRLGTEGTFSFEIDVGWVDKDVDPPADQFCLAHDGGTYPGWMLLKETTTPGIYPRPNLSFGTAHEIFVSSVGKGDKVNIVMIFSMGRVDTYIDGLLMQRLIQDDAALNNRFTNLYLGGDRTNANKGPNGYRIKNFKVLARKQEFPPHPTAGSVLFLGDSITNYGNFPLDMTQAGTYTDVLPFFPGLGYLEPGSSSPSSPGAFYDNGMQCAFFREMFNSGIYYGECNNESTPGEITSECLTRVTTFFGTNHKRTQTAVLFIGTNNLTASELNSSQIATAFADYKTIVTNLNTYGVTKLVCVRVPTLKTHSSYQTWMDTNVDLWNAEVDAVPAWATAQGYSIDIAVADVFNALGGHTDYGDYFVAGDIHPKELGNLVMGRTIAKAMRTII